MKWTMTPRTTLTAMLLAAAVPVLAGEKEISVTGWQLQDALRVSDAGEHLSSVSFQPSGWYPAIVPGTVLTSLVAAGVYPEPLYGENNRIIPESLSRTSYWYRTALTIPKAYKDRRTWLRFDGINYLAKVWVNGRSVGEIKGAFARGLFDVTPFVTPGQSAAIAVLVRPPLHPGTPHEQSLAGGAGPNGGAIGADGPTFNATVGWDWIPGIRDRNTGLWQGVALYSTGDVTVHDPFVTTDLPLPKTDRADLLIRTTVRNESDQPQSGFLEAKVEGTGASIRIPVTLAPHAATEVTGRTYLDRPRLWWPNGYGRPDLYKLTARFRTDKGQSDEVATQFGVREFSYFRNDGKDVTLQVNGVPVFCKGGNWGLDEAMKRSPRSRLEAQIRLHRDANVTMIRNWVGQSTQEEFYDLCDRYGILIWDDFWLANPADGPVPLDNALFMANAREKVLRFRNHPSIAIWCGRNEAMPPPALDLGMAELTRSLDGTRFYQSHSASGNGVSGGGPYGYRPPASYFSFNAAFHTEIGTPSIPTLEAIQAMMPRRDWWPINDDWAYHDLTRGAMQGDRYLGVLTDRFGPVTGLADFVRKGQLVNYESYRAIFEGRNSRLFNPATGVLLWMSNPSQPSFVWQLYSYDLEPNAAMFGTQKACEPIHIQMNPTTNVVQIINNLPTAKSFTATGEVYNLDGSKRSLAMKKVTAAPSTATEALILPSAAGIEIVRLTLRDGSRVVSENTYWRTIADQPNRLSELNNLAPVPVEIASSRQENGAVTRFRVTLKNRTNTIALMAHIQLRAGRDRVLPVYYSDNYVTLLPGESKTLTAECATEAVKDRPITFALDGWNVVAATSK